MRQFLARALRICHWYADHDWQYQEGKALKRTCNVCGRHEWGTLRGPLDGLIVCPIIRWRRMYVISEG